jgi:hypothetical protein
MQVDDITLDKLFSTANLHFEVTDKLEAIRENNLKILHSHEVSCLKIDD